MSHASFDASGPFYTILGAFSAAVVLVITRAAAYLARRWFPTAEEERVRSPRFTPPDEDEV